MPSVYWEPDHAAPDDFTYPKKPGTCPNNPSTGKSMQKEAASKKGSTHHAQDFNAARTRSKTDRQLKAKDSGLKDYF